MKAITFWNDTPEDFTWSWDSVPYTFKAGQRYMMEDWKAEHFALHLADRELVRLDGKRTKENQNPETHLGNVLLSDQFMKRFLPDEGTIEAPESKMQTELLNQASSRDVGKWCDSCDSRGVRHRKDCVKQVGKNVKTKLPEAEFDGLKV